MRKDQETPAKRPISNRPYPILLLALPFYIGGVMLLMKHGQATIGGERGAGSTAVERLTLSEAEVHAFGAVQILLGVAVTTFYFHVRREIKRDR